MPRKVGAGSQALKLVDLALSKTAGVAFDTLQFFNKFNPNASFTPKWSDKPLLKSWEKTKPTLGWPRQTDSLCPGCVKEARDAIFSGKKDWQDLMFEKVGEIKAQIIEHGSLWARRCADCRPHQSLQYDVRSLLYGRKPGRLRARTGLGRDTGSPGQRGKDQAAPPA